MTDTPFQETRERIEEALENDTHTDMTQMEESIRDENLQEITNSASKHLNAQSTTIRIKTGKGTLAKALIHIPTDEPSTAYIHSAGVAPDFQQTTTIGETFQEELEAYIRDELGATKIYQQENDQLEEL